MKRYTYTKALRLAEEIREELRTVVDRFRRILETNIRPKSPQSVAFHEQGLSLLWTARLALEEAAQYIEDIA